MGLSRKYSQLAILAGLVLLTAGMTWPWLVHFDQAVIGWPGDNYYFVWETWWFQDALLRRLILPLVVPSLNYPQGWQLAYNEITPLMILLGLPASFAGSPVSGYNFSLFLSFVLSGFGVYLWVYRLTRNHTAGFLSGIIFAFAPYRLSHLYGHLNLMGTQWLPFLFGGLHQLFEGRSDRRTAVLTGLFMGAIAWTSQYYLYMALILGLLYSVTCGLSGRRVVMDRKFWQSVGISASVGIPLTGVALWPYIRLATQGELPMRSFEEVRVWSASPSDFLLPSPKSFFWDDWVSRYVNRDLWVETTLYLGGITLLFAMVAIFARRYRQVRKPLLWVLGGAILLAMGTDLHWFGSEVSLSPPAETSSLFGRFVPLPGYFLFQYLPYYAGMRVWMRYGIFAILFAAVLAGLGFDLLLRRLGGKVRTSSVLLLLICIVADFYTGPVLLSPVNGRPVDLWLAQQPGKGAVAQFPYDEMMQPVHTYYTSVHGKPFVGGFFAASQPPQFRQAALMLSTFPSPQSVALLRGWNVRYVLVDRGAYQNFEQVNRQIEDNGLVFLADLGGQRVYLIEKRP